jgi:hypothetical protein
MSDAGNGSLWGRWLPHPGNALSPSKPGGWVVGFAGLLFGAPALSGGLGMLFGATRAPSVGAALGQLFAGAVGVAIGGVLLVSGEGALGGASIEGLSRSRPVAMLAARAALALAVVVGFVALLGHIGLGYAQLFQASGASLYDPAGALPVTNDADWYRLSGHGAAVRFGLAAAFWTLPPGLLVIGFASRLLPRLGAMRVRPAVMAWAGAVATLTLVAALAWGASRLGWYTASGAAVVWRGALWTLAGAGVTAALALLAQRRLAIWDHPERWRDATVTPDLRIVFADGSGARPASEYFRGYSGPVVVMPTAETAGSVFRGDGAPADGWLVPGTRAALEESVRCVRAMARVTVAAVGFIATAPMAAWLITLAG